MNKLPTRKQILQAEQCLINYDVNADKVKTILGAVFATLFERAIYSTRYRCRGVKLVSEDSGVYSYDSVDDDADADMFGVYEVQEDGTDSWMADFLTRELAEEYILLKENNEY